MVRFKQSKCYGKTLTDFVMACTKFSKPVSERQKPRTFAPHTRHRWPVRFPYRLAVAKRPLGVTRHSVRSTIHKPDIVRLDRQKGLRVEVRCRWLREAGYQTARRCRVESVCRESKGSEDGQFGEYAARASSGLACTVPETFGDDEQGRKGRAGQGVVRDERVRRLW